MKQIDRIRGHLKTINAHKLQVMKLCFRCGLYKQGLKHDLSKYSPLELKTGFHYYQGFRSPIDAQKEAEGLSTSWLHHKGRNMHHWEYWLDNGPNGIQAVQMPFPYVAEMFCDRVATSMTYQKDKYKDNSSWLYYKNSRDKVMLHPETRRQLEYLLLHLADYGLDATVALIRKLLTQYKKEKKITLPDRKFSDS